MAGEEKKRQAPGFKETERCPSAVVLKAARQKNDWVKRQPGLTGIPRRPTAISKHPNRVGNRTTTLSRLLIEKQREREREREGELFIVAFAPRHNYFSNNTKLKKNTCSKSQGT